MAKGCRSKGEVAFTGKTGNKSPDRKPISELGSKHNLVSSCPKGSWQEQEREGSADRVWKTNGSGVCGEVGKEQGEAAGSAGPRRPHPVSWVA